MMIESMIMACMLSGANSASWPMNVATGGDNIYWQSSSDIRADADTYACHILISYAEATVLWGGIEWGPFDVSDQIPSEVYNANANGPCPASFGTAEFITPLPPNPVTVAFDTTTTLTESGQCNITVDDITLGTAQYDLGWPIGYVTVQLVHMSFESTVYVDAFGTACNGDTNGDGSVDVVDILNLLAAWGNCNGDCPGDLNGDGLVDVIDLLAMLGEWGPCG